VLTISLSIIEAVGRHAAAQSRPLLRRAHCTGCHAAVDRATVAVVSRTHSSMLSSIPACAFESLHWARCFAIVSCTRARRAPARSRLALRLLACCCRATLACRCSSTCSRPTCSPAGRAVAAVCRLCWRAAARRRARCAGDAGLALLERMLVQRDASVLPFAPLPATVATVARNRDTFSVCASCSASSESLTHVFSLFHARWAIRGGRCYYRVARRCRAFRPTCALRLSPRSTALWLWPLTASIARCCSAAL
jgi:hypothetical protein